MPLNIINQSPNELKSNEVQELISYRPHWIIRNGNAIFILILLTLLAFSWFIKYPDIIHRQLKVYIQPNHGGYYGLMLVSKAELREIKPGQKLLIWVNGNPRSEFGYLSGTVGYIPNIPVADDSFLLKVNLPQGLSTNYNKTVVFHSDLDAQVDVIVNSRRLFDRFLEQLKKIIKR